MGSVNDQYARYAGVSGDAHIDGLKKGDDKPTKREALEADKVYEAKTDAPQTEIVDMQAAEDMSSSSVTLDEAPEKTAAKTNKPVKKSAAKKTAAKAKK